MAFVKTESKIQRELIIGDRQQENGYCRGYYSPNNTKTKKPIMH
jgi:hypothetical protein